MPVQALVLHPAKQLYLGEVPMCRWGDGDRAVARVVLSHGCMACGDQEQDLCA